MKRTRPKISAARARKLFAYNRRTGMLTWRVPRRGVKVGDRAGHVTRRPNDKRTHKAYRRLYIDGVYYLEHRLIWLIETGAWPKCEIDHENGDGEDNRWRNLREADRAQNRRNIGARNNNKTGFKWVHRTKAGLYQGDVRFRIGPFKSAMQAHIATCRITKALHGRFFNDGRSPRPGAARAPN